MAGMGVEPWEARDSSRSLRRPRVSPSSKVVGSMCNPLPWVSFYRKITHSINKNLKPLSGILPNRQTFDMDQCTPTPETVFSTSKETTTLVDSAGFEAWNRFDEEIYLQDIRTISRLAQITEKKMSTNNKIGLSRYLLLTKFYCRLQNELYIRRLLSLIGHVPRQQPTYPTHAHDHVNAAKRVDAYVGDHVNAYVRDHADNHVDVDVGDYAKDNVNGNVGADVGADVDDHYVNADISDHADVGADVDDYCVNVYVGADVDDHYVNVDVGDRADVGAAVNDNYVNVGDVGVDVDDHAHVGADMDADVDADINAHLNADDDYR